MERMVKISVIVGALLAGIGIFYHYVIFLPSMERQKVERSENEKQKAAISYELCKASVSEDYSANWAAACEDVALIQTSSLRNCLARSLNSWEKDDCKSTYDIDPSPDCSLPKTRSGSINQRYQDAQQRCLAEAKSGF